MAVPGEGRRAARGVRVGIHDPGCGHDRLGGGASRGRGKGLAAACTVAATNEALRRGAEVVSLQASSMGEDLYRRLGYEELYCYRLLGAMPG